VPGGRVELPAPRFSVAAPVRDHMLASILVLEKARCKPLASTDGCRIRPSCCQRWVPGLAFRMAVRGSLAYRGAPPSTIHCALTHVDLRLTDRLPSTMRG